jgi:cytochrome c-type biogenesis protein CcsB
MSGVPSMSVLSDWLFTSAFGVYMLAALFCAAEYSLSRYPVGRRKAELVTAGADIRTITAGQPAPREVGFAPKCGRIGVALTVLGGLVHLGSIVLRGIAAGRVPWANMYEYMSAVGLVAITSWLYLLRKHQVRRLSVFVLLPTALLLFIAGNQLYTEAVPLQPALRSYWIAIHVAAAIMASGVFLLSGVVSGLHLMSNNADSDTTPAKKSIGNHLPPADYLDRVAYRTGTFGFVTLTFAIITGAIWAEMAWGRFWGWDPKETVAFVSWVCYAAYLHARATAGWRGRRSAWINIAGMVVVLFNLFFINLVAVGLHSYAGVN